MYTLLHFTSYLAAIVAFLFVTLSLASGLLYLAEVIEEHTRFAKAVGQRTIYAVIALHVIFCLFDGLPFGLTCLGIFAHLVYLQNFGRFWPFISLTSIRFISSCLLVLITHFSWFVYFGDLQRTNRSSHHYPSYSGGHPKQPYRPAWDDNFGRKGSEADLTFLDVATFFGVCVWLVPFFLFLSLSANDNVLPSRGDNTSINASNPPTPSTTSQPNNLIPPTLNAHGMGGSSGASLLRSSLDSILSILPRSGKGRRVTSRSQYEGLIASPARSAPPSPGLNGMFSPTMGTGSGGNGNGNGIGIGGAPFWAGGVAGGNVGQTNGGLGSAEGWSSPTMGMGGVRSESPGGIGMGGINGGSSSSTLAFSHQATLRKIPSINHLQQQQQQQQQQNHLPPNMSNTKSPPSSLNNASTSHTMSMPRPPGLQPRRQQTSPELSRGRPFSPTISPSPLSSSSNFGGAIGTGGGGVSQGSLATSGSGSGSGSSLGKSVLNGVHLEEEEEGDDGGVGGSDVRGVDGGAVTNAIPTGMVGTSRPTTPSASGFNGGGGGPGSGSGLAKRTKAA